MPTVNSNHSSERLQALERGLEVLAHVNRFGVVRAGPVARALRLSRSTAHRILNVLVELELLRVDVASHQYFLAPGVRELSRGFRDTPWIVEVAVPMLREWTTQHHWPLVLVTPIDGVLTVRESTDHISPISVERFVPGETMPLDDSAAGIVWQAWLGTGYSTVRAAGFYACPTACLSGARIAVPLTYTDTFVGAIVMLCLPETVADQRRTRQWAETLNNLAMQVVRAAGTRLGNEKG